MHVMLSPPFDPANPHDRWLWRYDSDAPLSAAELIARHSVDAPTMALLWLLIERGASFTVAGGPMGIGKTTTLNALLQFVPKDVPRHYLAGMLEDFRFTEGPSPACCAICNEINDYPPYYLWGASARRFLSLAEEGYQIATTVHAETAQEVIVFYHRLGVQGIGALGIIVNLSWVPDARPFDRRFRVAHFLMPAGSPEKKRPFTLLQLVRWKQKQDTFAPASRRVHTRLATWAGMDLARWNEALARRRACLQALSSGEGVGMDMMAAAVEDVRHQEQGKPPEK
jgi:hypothetical protein